MYVKTNIWVVHMSLYQNQMRNLGGKKILQEVPQHLHYCITQWLLCKTSHLCRMLNKWIPSPLLSWIRDWLSGAWHEFTLLAYIHSVHTSVSDVKGTSQTLLPLYEYSEIIWTKLLQDTETWRYSRSVYVPPFSSAIQNSLLCYHMYTSPFSLHPHSKCTLSKLTLP